MIINIGIVVSLILALVFGMAEDGTYLVLTVIAVILWLEKHFVKKY